MLYDFNWLRLRYRATSGDVKSSRRWWFQHMHF